MSLSVALRSQIISIGLRVKSMELGAAEQSAFPSRLLLPDPLP